MPCNRIEKTTVETSLRDVKFLAKGLLNIPVETSGRRQVTLESRRGE